MRAFRALSILLLTALAATTGCSAGSAVAPGPSFMPGVVPPADLLCQLLTPADWAAAGLSGAGAPKVSSGEDGSAYCVYAGESGDSGGLEFDAWCCYSVGGLTDTYTTMKEGMADPRDVTLANCQECAINPDAGTFGAIAGRNGTFAFGIALPPSAQAESQLKTLAGIVLQRASALFDRHLL